MDQGKVFEKLLKLSGADGLRVAFLPLQSSCGRLKGNRIGLCYGMGIEKMNYTLAHELAHVYLHHDKGDTINDVMHDEYEEQADRAAKLLLHALELE